MARKRDDEFLHLEEENVYTGPVRQRRVSRSRKSRNLLTARRKSKTAGKTPLMVAMDGGKGVGMAGGPGDIREGRAPPFREEGNRTPADAVALLLSAGADADALTEDGEAAIHMAAKSGYLDVIRALAAGGATLDLPDGEGKTALEIVDAMEPREEGPLTGAQVEARKRAQPAEVAELLRELMASGDSAQANLQEDR